MKSEDGEKYDELGYVDKYKKEVNGHRLEVHDGQKFRFLKIVFSNEIEMPISVCHFKVILKSKKIIKKI
jgi:hypothetical protein